MAKAKFTSPTLTGSVTPEAWETAKQSKSGACLAADGLKARYPHLSKIRVDMATIRATDRKKGLRYIYLTPPDVQHLLLFFDQGWKQPVEEFTIRRAVKIVPVVAASPDAKTKRERRRQELEAKLERGEKLTQPESRSLTQLRRPPRSTARGRAQVNREGIIHGGTPPPTGGANPNLLRGTDRHFGAKLANPGQVFEEAVEQAVAEKIANGEV